MDATMAEAALIAVVVGPVAPLAFAAEDAAALQAALQREPFAWVRRNIRQALAKLDAKGDKPAAAR